MAKVQLTCGRCGFIEYLDSFTDPTAAGWSVDGSCPACVKDNDPRRSTEHLESNSNAWVTREDAERRPIRPTDLLVVVHRFRHSSGGWAELVIAESATGPDVKCFIDSSEPTWTCICRSGAELRRVLSTAVTSLEADGWTLEPPPDS